MGIGDDWPTSMMHKTRSTGHVYTRLGCPMLGWQLISALFKLFGFSLTTVRMSTLL